MARSESVKVFAVCPEENCLGVIATREYSSFSRILENSPKLRPPTYIWNPFAGTPTNPRGGLFSTFDQSMFSYIAYGVTSKFCRIGMDLARRMYQPLKSDLLSPSSMLRSLRWFHSPWSRNPFHWTLESRP